MFLHQCVFTLLSDCWSVCLTAPFVGLSLCCDSRQNKSVLWHLSETPLMVTPLLYYSCHKLLSSISPFHCFSALFLSRSLMQSLNHPLFPVSFPIHLPQSSSSILLSVLTNLPLYPSEHFLCPLPPSLHILLPLYPPPSSLFSPEHLEQ